MTTTFKPERYMLHYFDTMLKQVEEFKALAEEENGSEAARIQFHELISTLLSPPEAQTRAVQFMNEVGVSYGTLRRYITGVSAPIPSIFPVIAEILKDILTTEKVSLEAAIVQQEKEAEERIAASNKEWKELTDRIYRPIKSTLYNSKISFEMEAAEGSFAESMHISFPCRGIYEFSDHFPHVCHVCESGRRDILHGRVFLSSEDGLLLLPHIVKTQADILQCIADIENSSILALYGTRKDITSEKWFFACQTHITSDPFFQSLPKKSHENPTSYDLDKEKTVWVFL